METQIKQDLKAAQFAKDETKVSTLRMLLSELTYARVKKGVKNTDEILEDEEVVTVVAREIKKRQESVEAFEKAGRTELAEKEKAEIEILKVYLPPQMSDEELVKIVEDAISETGAAGVADMGKVIGLVMQKVGQSATGGQVSSIVKQKLMS